MLDRVPSQTAREPARRLTVTLLFVFYVLLLAEGPLRKWLLPGASNALVFLRDPVMVAILLAAVAARPSPGARRALAAFGGVLLVFLACIMGQLATSPVPPLAILAGLRNYFLFVPLCWILNDAFTAADYARWLRLNLWLAGPVGALVVMQYQASPTAWINAAPGGGNDGVFLLVEDVVRPYGLFSFTLGHSVFAAWMVGVLLAAVSAPRAFGVRPCLTFVGGLGIAAMGAFSGARTFLILAAAVLITYLVAALASPEASARRKALAVALGLAALAGSAPILMPDLVARLNERQTAAVASEGSTVERVGQVVTEFTGQLQTVSALGVGLGAGTNVANYLANGRTDRVLAEYELTRIVQELGPFFGLLAILLRWALAGGLAVATWRAARRGNLQPACHLGLVAPLLLVHDVTLQNSMIGIAWFATGILVTSLRLQPVVAAARPAAKPAPVREVRACA